MPGCNEEDQNVLISRARKIISTYEDMAELIRLGAYRKGSNAEVDEAIYYFPRIEAILRQQKTDRTDLATCYKLLAEALQPQAAVPTIEVAPAKPGAKPAPAPAPQRAR
jgi:flagellum-specific ATP synthase